MRQIAVLEDDAFRTTTMRKAAAHELTDDSFQWFSNAFEMIEWLKENLDSVRLLSLDYDLDSTAITGTDCGSGEDVAAFVIAQAVRLPVVIHSSNALRAPGMHFNLALAGFKAWLCPFTDGTQWVTDIRRAIELSN